MNLTLILPITLTEVQKGELLAERHFNAGAVTIVVLSVLTHHEGGTVTLRSNTPEIQIRSKNDVLPYDREKLSVNEFSGIFAKALQDAEIHAMQVAKWIEERINFTVLDAIRLNRFGLQESLRTVSLGYPCPMGHDWEKHIDPAKPSACLKCAAVRDNVTGEITYPKAQGRFV